MSKNNSQIPFNLGHKPSFERVDFIVSTSNQAATMMIDRWPDWPLHVAALIGPPGSGKTHLMQSWLKQTKGTIFNKGMNIGEISSGIAVAVDNCDSGQISDEDLFHLYNWQKEKRGSLLLLARSVPNHWGVELPDLASRLATIPVSEIAAPDDMLLHAVLIKLFSDRQLLIDINIINYIVARMERSFDVAVQIVTKLDNKALVDKRAITIPLARDCLLELGKAGL